MSRTVPTVSSSHFQGEKNPKETKTKERAHDSREEKLDDRKQQWREREQTVWIGKKRMRQIERRREMWGGG